MPSFRHASVRFTAALGFVLLPALSSGQRLQAQRPSGPYYERSGTWYGQYDIDPGRARVAVLAALADMHMPISQEGFWPSGSFLDTRTPDKFEARLTIRPLGPSGAGTQVGVRVGGFGTHPQVCARILDEIARHLDAARRLPPPPVVLVFPAPVGRIEPASPSVPPPVSAALPPALPPQPIPMK
jgi:hypothetical protein